jgi:CRISPR-associated protein Cmr1
LRSRTKGYVHPQFQTHDAARYLGYGLMEAFASMKKHTQAGQLLRGCIDEEQRFIVELRFRNAVDRSLEEALIALGLFGALGSRSRHGMVAWR